jgi:hypothetical protein
MMTAMIRPWVDSAKADWAPVRDVLVELSKELRPRIVPTDGVFEVVERWLERQKSRTP